jgi:hypothetical protein
MSLRSLAAAAAAACSNNGSNVSLHADVLSMNAARSALYKFKGDHLLAGAERAPSSHPVNPVRTDVAHFDWRPVANNGAVDYGTMSEVLNKIARTNNLSVSIKMNWVRNHYRWIVWKLASYERYVWFLFCFCFCFCFLTSRTLVQILSGILRP